MPSKAALTRPRDKSLAFPDAMIQGFLREEREPGTGKSQHRVVLNRLPKFGAIREFGPSDTRGYDWHFRDKDARWHDLRDAELKARLPYAVGDRIDPAIEIPGYPDYCVGISGIVYSRKKGEWTRLQAAPTSRGYPAITLCARGRRRTTHTHTLTCEAFHGPRPSPVHQARHINGNRADGSAANLCWGTQEENWRDRKAHGNDRKGEKHHYSKFTDKEREHIRWGYEQGMFSQRHASRILGVTQSTINSICCAEIEPVVEQDAPDHSGFRLTLLVTEVRVERLADLTDLDALEEGALSVDLATHGPKEATGRPPLGQSPRSRFRHLWDAQHGAGAFDANPWCCVLTLRPTLANIDALPAEADLRREVGSEATPERSGALTMER